MLKADYHHQYIWSSVNLSCLVMKTPRNGNTAAFLHWCPCEELFSKTEPLKGQVFFSITFYYGAPPTITKKNLTRHHCEGPSKRCCCQVICLFFTKLCKPSFLTIFLQGLLSLTFEGPLLVNSLWDTIFSQYPFLPLFKSFLDAFPDVFISDMIHCKHIVPFSKIRF